MAWLKILLSFFFVFIAAIGTSLLSMAWRRRRKPSPEAARIEARLPGYDCGLCGSSTCRDYAAAVNEKGRDPALCAPGGAKAEEAIREILGERHADSRSRRMRAVIRCGGGDGVSAFAFDYDNREDCASAAALYGGPKVCKEGCLGFGSCATACPLAAIRVKKGLASIDAELCSGCGDCIPACPKGLISLVPAEESWYVACSSRMEAETRLEACKAACDACGECARRSMIGEFSISEGLARAARASQEAGAAIAPMCPTGAIRPIAPKKTSVPPFGRSDPRL
jgi:electron transport complex protein RnfB